MSSDEYEFVDGVGGVHVYRMREVKFFDTHAMIHAYQKIEFPTLEHFIEEVTDVGIPTVRLDLFEEVKPSELSFVHYVTLTLYLTAQDLPGYAVYEYKECLGTTVSADGKYQAGDSVQSAQSRLQAVQNELSLAELRIRHGRYTLPDGDLM